MQRIHQLCPIKSMLCSKFPSRDVPTWLTSLSIRWGKPEEGNATREDENQEPIEKPNFGLSGALAKDRVTGNAVNGVVMKWSEPTNARKPQCRWRLYVFKGETSIGMTVEF